MNKIVQGILIGALLLGNAFAQSTSKGLKALEAKDYPAAWENFEGAVQDNPSDVAAQFGLSKLYGIEGSGNKSKEKALEHLVAAENAWAKLDEKGKAKVEKSGVTFAELNSRRNQIESSFLEAAKDVHTIEAYDEFLKNFPESKHAVAATNYRNALAWDQARENGSVAAMDEFLTKYPDADEVKVATPIRDERATVLALQAGTEEALTNFLSKYPAAIQAPQIKQRLNAVAFENAKLTNTIAVYREYIERYPDSVFLTQAKERLEWLENQE